MSWQFFALVSCSLLSLHLLTLSILTKLGTNFKLINACVFFLVGLILMVIKLSDSFSFQVTLKEGVLIGLSAVGAIGCILFQIYAFSKAPNPGYVTAIQNMSTIIVALLAVLFFSNPLSLVKGIGIVLVMVGVSLVCLF